MNYIRNIRGVPTELKAALNREALESGRSMTDTVTKILSDYFELEPELFGGKTTNPSLSSQLMVRMEKNGPLSHAIWAAAREWGLTESSAVIRILAAHYGLPYEPKRFGRKRVA